MKDLILLGAGGHAKSCIDAVEAGGVYRIVGLIDAPEKLGSEVFGYRVIGCDGDLPDFVGKDVEFLVSLGQLRSCARREGLFAELKKLGLKPATVVSPLARVSPHASIGQGSAVLHFALVNAGAKVGENCIINSKAIVEHDAEIGDNCHISTAAVINGGAKVRMRSFVGSNATVSHGAEVPEGAFVKAGSVVK